MQLLAHQHEEAINYRKLKSDLRFKAFQTGEN
jgi:hypothetical protein